LAIVGLLFCAPGCGKRSEKETLVASAAEEERAQEAVRVFAQKNGAEEGPAIETGAHTADVQSSLGGGRKLLFVARVEEVVATGGAGYKLRLEGHSRDIYPFIHLTLSPAGPSCDAQQVLPRKNEGSGSYAVVARIADVTRDQDGNFLLSGECDALLSLGKVSFWSITGQAHAGAPVGYESQYEWHKSLWWWLAIVIVGVFSIIELGRWAVFGRGRRGSRRSRRRR
jgi:hypothetical protein